MAWLVWQVHFVHSETNKVDMTVGVVAIKAIKKGDQILVDYGRGYWRLETERDEGDPEDVSRSFFDQRCLVVSAN